MTAFASTGIACPLAWGFLINAFGRSQPLRPASLDVFLSSVGSGRFAVAAVSRKAPAFFSSGISTAVAGVLGAFGSLAASAYAYRGSLRFAPIRRNGPLRMRSWLAIPAVGHVLREARFASCGGLPAAGQHRGVDAESAHAFRPR